MAACDGDRSTRPIALLLLFESCNTSAAIDRRTSSDLIDFIEAKGLEIAEALKVLRAQASMTEGHQDTGLWKAPFASVNAGGNWLAIRSDCRILFRKVATRFSSALCC